MSENELEGVKQSYIRQFGERVGLEFFEKNKPQIIQTLEKERKQTPSTAIEPPRSPRWVSENIGAIVNAAEFTTEEEVIEAARKAYTVAQERERQNAIEKGYEIIARHLNFQFLATETLPTIEELKQSIQKMSTGYIESEAQKWQGLADTGKRFRESVRASIERQLKGQITNPEILKNEVAKYVRLYEKDFPDVDKAVPFFEEIANVFRQRLEEVHKLQAEQQEKAPKILKDMQKLSESAQKLYSKIEGLLTEYQKRGDPNILQKVAIHAKDFQRLSDKYLELKSELSLIELHIPPMRDLPILPKKVWRIMEQQGGES